jgi:hypothetical protein
LSHSKDGCSKFKVNMGMGSLKQKKILKRPGSARPHLSSVRLGTLFGRPILADRDDVPVQPRYVVNRVTAGDYDCPAKVASFLSDLYAAFRLLNLRNDFLRKRFDGEFKSQHRPRAFIVARNQVDESAAELVVNALLKR